jgi:valyl-tRNA synthetase
MQAEGRVEKIEPHAHSVGHCYRCKTIVEPNLSKQWFVKTKPLADKAIEAVESGETRIIPATWKKTYYEWMYNIRDWCISRQIWWGHQIPAWTCDACGEVMVRMEAPEICDTCGGQALTRETDVLDTWFSSALWPFSTMGWPEHTPLLKTFYPTSVLVTGFDILFFWVARMMMMGIHFMKEVPFKDVYVHALVRDEHGKKMSKSKGNVIDPLNIIDKYGTDAFRFTLAAFAAQGRDVKMSEKRVEGYRNFVNKLWNATRFALMHLKEGAADIPLDQISLVDRWILSRLGRTVTKVSEALDDYRFNEAASAAYNFVWHELCDWYIEAVKPALYGKKGEASQQAALAVLWRALRDTLILLHPFMPFITEEIWHKLPGTQGSIMKAVFPGDDPSLARDAAAEEAMQVVIEVITGVRNIRGEMNVAPSLALKVALRTRETHIREVVEANTDMIVDLAKLEAFHIEASGEKPKASATAIINGATIFASLEGIIDIDKESARLQKEIDKLDKELAGVSKKLANESFLSKAPEEIVAKVKEKHAQLSQRQEKLTVNLNKITELSD